MIVLATGVAGLEALARAIVLFPVMVLGAWAGGRLFHGLASERLYRNVALAILFATGMFGLLRTWLFVISSAAPPRRNMHAYRLPRPRLGLSLSACPLPAPGADEFMKSECTPPRRGCALASPPDPADQRANAIVGLRKSNAAVAVSGSLLDPRTLNQNEMMGLNAVVAPKPIAPEANCT